MTVKNPKDIFGPEDLDPKFYEALKLSVEMQQISTSSLQRKLSLGYGRAAQIIDTMEELGMVAPYNGTKPRKVLITREEYIEITGDDSIGEPIEDHAEELDIESFLKTLVSIEETGSTSVSDADEALNLDLFDLGEDLDLEEILTFDANVNTTTTRSNTVYIFLADGFEMIEALTPCDVLHRAGLDVRLVSTNGKKHVRSSHGIEVKADMALNDVDPDAMDLMILPGGMPGATNLYANDKLIKLLFRQARAQKPIAAICAAPFILGKCGLLKGKKATCYPGFEDDLLGATVTADGVVRDGNIITAKGMGVSLDFALAITELLSGKEKRDEIAHAIMYE